MKTTFQRVLPFIACTFLLFPKTIFSQSATDYFRSKQSGSWSTNTIWESSPDNISWSNTNLIPGDKSKGVIIQAGHSITLASSITLQTINLQGTLLVNNSTLKLVTPGIVDNSGVLKYTLSKIDPAIPFMTWKDGSRLVITGDPGSIITGLNQSFSKLQWNCPSPSSTSTSLNLDNGFEVRDSAYLIHYLKTLILTEKAGVTLNFKNLKTSNSLRLFTSKNNLYSVNINISGDLVMDTDSRIETSNPGDLITLGGDVSMKNSHINRSTSIKKQSTLSFEPTKLGQEHQVYIFGTTQCTYLVKPNVSVKFNLIPELSSNRNIINNFGTVTATTILNSDPLNLILRPGSSLLTNYTVPATVEIATTDADWSQPMDGWHIISSPVAQQSLTTGGFISAIPDSYDFFAWSEPGGMWLNQKVSENNITSFTPGMGYLAAYDNGGVKTFTGNLNVTNIQFTNLSKQGDQYSGYHLLGTPFTCPISWNHPDWNRENISEVAHVWNESAENYLPVTGPGSSIPTNQGFFIQVLDAQNSIIIPASSRIIEQVKTKNIESHKLHLRVTNESNGTYDEVIIQLKEDALSGFDKWDGHDIPGSSRSPQLYSLISGDEHCSVNSLPIAQAPLDVLLEFIPGVEGNFNIKVLSSTLPGSVYLEDRQTNSINQLTPDFEYIFTGKPSDADNRFLIHMNPVAVNKTGLSRFQVYSAAGNIYLNGLTSTANVSVHDLSGRQLFKSIYGKDNLSVINASAFKKGIYLVTVDSANETITRKIVL